MVNEIERQFVLCCLRGSIGEARSLIHRGLDWNAALDVALQQRVMPSVYRKLSTVLASEVPAVELQRFREHYEANAVRDVYLTAELRRLLTIFEEAGIDSIPYKGPALSTLISGNIHSEQLADLDIIIRKRDFKLASDLLAAQGYEPHFKLREPDEGAFLRLSYVQLFRRERDRTLVELHWQIAPRFFIPPFLDDQFWSRIGQTDLLGKTVNLPATEDMFLMLCIHGAKDMWERLKWIYGLSEFIIARPDLDWSSVFARAEALGLYRIVLLALRLVHDILQTPLPEDVQQRVNDDDMAARLASEVRQLVFAGPPTLKQRIFFHLRVRERLRDRVRYLVLFATTTTPVDWAVLPLPPSLSFAYLLTRPIRLFKKYVLKASNARAEKPANF